ncbi:hypothetical protein EHE19_002765 [Ruminiclostridium herbifermentans]|uniref:Glycine zipper-like domain-containing protein n=1 Tax=Ruminiclostridium herbifermentans TaxID=2488810 RepID=A0A4U7JFC4_9FIRM|nr:hypothetical protein [Ruminiclostridium herbifermentans]QNU67466.1 hypothetical protein EHE19_002765 [Ruminiclostridium herbifermentans]
MDIDESLIERILAKIFEKKVYMDKKQINYYRLDLVERITKRLASFHDECKDCEGFIGKLENYIDTIGTNTDKQTKREYDKYLNAIISHFASKHKLVDDNYYLSTYMTIGMMFGMVFGAVGIIGDSSNMGIGISIGLCIGVALGVSQDAKAKKDGRVI